jgi:hypothetical protein
MKKKIGFNIILFVFITGSILILSCKGKSYRMAGGVLLKADREFSEMSVKEGMHKALPATVSSFGMVPIRQREGKHSGKDLKVKAILRSPSAGNLWQSSFQKAGRWVTPTGFIKAWISQAEM